MRQTAARCQCKAFITATIELYTLQSQANWFAPARLLQKEITELKLESKLEDKTGALSGSFRGISVQQGVNRLRYSNLVAVKNRDFFYETSPQPFVLRGLINSYCFRRDKYVF